MHRFKHGVLLLSAVMLWLQASVGMSQERQVRGYVLTKVLTAHDPKGVGPTLVEADAKGGKVVVQLPYGGDRIEKTTYEWKFDRDIRFLPHKSRFTQTTTVTTSGDSDRNPFAYPHSSFYFLRSRLSEEEHNTGSATLIADPPRSEGVQRIHGKTLDSPPRTGTASDLFEAETENVAGKPYMFLAMNLNASTRQGYYGGEILYVFRAVYTDTPPGDEPIEIDNPRSGAGTTVSIPPSQSTPGTPPTSVTPLDSCLDPAVQKCIEQWLDMAVALRNQKQPELGPWSISRYGHWLNRQVTSFQAPDEWETKYHSSKYCFVAMNYGREHEVAVYGGQLPALADYVARCVGEPTGGTPGGTGTGTDSDGDGIPDNVDPDDDNDGIPDTRDNTPTGANTQPPSSVAERTLWAPTRIVRTGQRVLIPIWLLRPDGVANMDFEVAYDASVIEPLGNVVKGSLLGGARLEANNQKQDLVILAFAQTSPLASDGIVANLPFLVVGSAGQRTPLTLRVTDIDDVNGNPLPIRLIDGEVIIQDPDQGTRCDCDGDGQLTIADAICALKMAVDLMPLDLNMDFNGDGQVTSGDAREILKAIP